MTPTDPTRDFHPDPNGPTANAPAPDSAADSGLDAGLAAAFGSDDTAAATADFAGKDEHVGAILGGKYKLIEAIGEGGMGSVFLAQQIEPVKRLVAVKVIKAGMDSKAVLARFEAERQALALMDHPNIARVLDAGTTESGRPFFVMELVKGVPITHYCDERKLTPQQRLELFVPVCNAIQHAHQKGVIHRDIKPSNVLVALYDDKPVPKVIDFGVAKAAGPTLTDKTLMTGFGAVVGTPEYMSPEQANLNNLDIDTRSDVYALGVLLYELLTGTTPVDRKSLGKAALLEVLRIVREVEAPRPSAKLSTSDALPSISANRGTEPRKLTGLLRSELDWIVLKALEKDRTRRYETANGFAADVLRYLSGEAVQAHPPSRVYRLKKFVRRNRVQVIAASLVLLALVAGVIGTTWQAIRADRARADETEQRMKAEDQQREARASEARAIRAEGRTRRTLDGVDKLLTMKRTTGGKPTLEVTNYLDELAREFAELADSGTGTERAENLIRLAAVQQLQGKNAEMEQSYAAAIDYSTSQTMADPARAKEHYLRLGRIRRTLSAARKPLAFELNSQERWLPLLRAADADFRAAAEADPTDPVPLRERIELLGELLRINSLELSRFALTPLEKQRFGSERRELNEARIGCLTRLTDLVPRQDSVYGELITSHMSAFRPSVNPALEQGATTEQLIAALRHSFLLSLKAYEEFGEQPATDRLHGLSSQLSGQYRLLFGTSASWEAQVPLLIESAIASLRAVRRDSEKSGVSVAEIFRQGIADPWRELGERRKKYRDAGGIELMVALGEAVLGEQPNPPTGSPVSAADPTGPLVRAFDLARLPTCRFHPDFLRAVWDISDYDPRSSPPIHITAEEYLWCCRLGALNLKSRFGNAAAKLVVLRAWEKRPGPPPTLAFRQRLMLEYANVLGLEGVDQNASGEVCDRLIDQYAKYTAALPPAEDHSAFRDTTLRKVLGRVASSLQKSDAASPEAKKRFAAFVLLVADEAGNKPANWTRYARHDARLLRADVQMKQGEWAAALDDYREGLLGLEEARGNINDQPERRAAVQFQIAVCLLRLVKLDEADRAFSAALDLRRATKSKLPLPTGKPAVHLSAVACERDWAEQNRMVGRWTECDRWSARALKTLDETGEVAATVKWYRCDLHLLRANALAQQKNFADAAKELDAAAKFANEQQTRRVQLTAGPVYPRVGRGEEAIRRLDELARLGSLNRDEAYDLACGFAVCSAADGVSKSEASARQEKAMLWLGKAVQAGFRDAAHIKQDVDLDPLRGREDFKKLLADLEAKSPPPRELAPKPREVK